MNAPLIGARDRAQRGLPLSHRRGPVHRRRRDARTRPTRAFVRSPHAHAKIKKINIDKALKAPGVIGIFTGDDLADAKVGGLPCGWLITDVNGQPMKEPPHPCLAQGKVRYVGDHVAVVIAETLDAGAATPRSWSRSTTRCCPRSCDAGEARKKGAAGPRRRARQHLLRLGARRQGRGATRPSPRRAHVTKLEFINNRLIPNAIEPRAAIGELLAAPTTPTRCTSRARTRTSSAC